MTYPSNGAPPSSSGGSQRITMEWGVMRATHRHWGGVGLSADEKWPVNNRWFEFRVSKQDRQFKIRKNTFGSTVALNAEIKMKCTNQYNYRNFYRILTTLTTPVAIKNKRLRLTNFAMDEYWYIHLQWRPLSVSVLGAHAEHILVSFRQRPHAVWRQIAVHLRRKKSNWWF